MISSLFDVGSLLVETVRGVVDATDKDMDDIKNKHLTMISANGSITRLLSEFIIEPLIMVDDSLRHEEVTDKIIRLNVDTFASFYAQAFYVMVQILGVEIETTLNVMSSKYTNSLGLVSKIKDLDERIDNLSYEDKKALEAISFMTLKPGTEAKPTAVLDQNEDKINSILTKNLELSLEVREDENSKLTKKVLVPIVIKAHIAYASITNIQDMISIKSNKKTMMSRWHDFRAGAISFWGDYVLANDLIKDYKKKKLKDEADLINYMDDRTYKSRSKIATAGAKGFSEFYSMVILNKDNQAIIEKEINGKLAKEKFKDIFLTRSKSLAVTVVDVSWERFTIAIKDVTGKSEANFKALKKKPENEELTDMMKALLSNKPPVI